MTITASVERLDTGSPNGCLMGGAATDLIGFYGNTPVTRSSATAITAIGTVVFSEAKTGIWGFDTSTNAARVVAAINQLVVDVGVLKTMGLFT